MFFLSGWIGLRRRPLKYNIIIITCCGVFRKDLNGISAFPLSELIDIEKELARLDKERTRVEGEIRRAEGKLNNPGFMAKAPEKVVGEERAKLAANKDLMDKLLKRIEELKK